MEEEHLFAIEDLTLKQLAQEINITSHQLSQLLNEHLEMNFNKFINIYRINEAKRLLIEEQDRTILSIAYAVGFNSKSSFYGAFTKLTGLTPIKYRESNTKQ